MVERARPRIAITTGEPAGIGPEISIAALSEPTLRDRVRAVMVGDAKMLALRAAQLANALPLVPYRADEEPPENSLEVLDVPLAVGSVPGRLEVKNVPAILAMLDRAIDGALKGEFEAVVTAPLQKSIINQAGVPFSGHTEYFAERTAAKHVVMMLVGGGMRVALATIHLALADVPKALTAASLEATLRVLARGLTEWFGLEHPRILVAGLNPHAGESGVLGREEIDVIAPTLDRLRAEGFELSGPLPADTLFQPKLLSNCDAVLAMYHDQGLPVLKYASFGEGVNVTLGLPIIRSSVDHGTALDLAGTGRANAGSMRAAIELALGMHAARARAL
jgi:4-hydroxythreonine-4-phosphate dehydrogenase